MKRLIMLALLVQTGCVPFHYHGQSYHLILGAGLIRVSDTNQVTVVKSQSLGLYVGDGRANLGLSQVYQAKVPTNANVLIEITK